jgi:hypothetical protein
VIEGYAGQALLLELVLADRTTGKYPRARILDDAGVQIGSPVNLSASPAAGWAYYGAWTPPSAGQFFAVFDVYDDVGHTTLSAYDSGVDHLRIHTLEQDLSFQKLLAHQGENVRDDVLTYDVNNRPLTFRRRIFATKSAADASTAGGTGEGEIATIVGTATHFSAATWETLLRTLQP